MTKIKKPIRAAVYGRLLALLFGAHCQENIGAVSRFSKQVYGGGRANRITTKKKLVEKTFSARVFVDRWKRKKESSRIHCGHEKNKMRVHLNIQQQEKRAREREKKESRDFLCDSVCHGNKQTNIPVELSFSGENTLYQGLIRRSHSWMHWSKWSGRWEKDSRRVLKIRPTGWNYIPCFRDDQEGVEYR